MFTGIIKSSEKAMRKALVNWYMCHNMDPLNIVFLNNDSDDTNLYKLTDVPDDFLIYLNKYNQAIPSSQQI